MLEDDFLQSRERGFGVAQLEAQEFQGQRGIEAGAGQPQPVVQSVLGPADGGGAVVGQLLGDGERSWIVEGKTVEYLDAWSYTEFFNLLGNPALVVPVGSSPEGLPIGVQLVARYGDEATLLRLAAQLEQALPWALRHPSI